MWKKRQISSLLCTTYHSTAFSPSSSFFLPLIPPSTFSSFVCCSSSNEPKMLFLHFRSSRLISAALEENGACWLGDVSKAAFSCCYHAAPVPPFPFDSLSSLHAWCYEARQSFQRASMLSGELVSVTKAERPRSAALWPEHTGSANRSDGDSCTHKEEEEGEVSIYTLGVNVPVKIR